MPRTISRMRGVAIWGDQSRQRRQPHQEIPARTRGVSPSGTSGTSDGLALKNPENTRVYASPGCSPRTEKRPEHPRLHPGPRKTRKIKVLAHRPRMARMSRMVNPHLARTLFRAEPSAAADPTATALVPGHDPARRSHGSYRRAAAAAIRPGSRRRRLRDQRGRGERDHY